MTELARTLIRAGGWPRMILVAGCTAVVSGLLLVVIAILRLPARPSEWLNPLVAETGLRGGTAFATVLLTVPVLLLLHQAVRLGTAARERRLAAMRLAGATPGEIRYLGAVEVGVPAAAGGVLGIAFYWLLRVTLGGVPSRALEGTDGLLPVGTVDSAGYLVPTTVGPTWWQIILVVLGVAALGVAVGAGATRRLILTPLGVARRHAAGPPRAWGLIPLGVATLVAAVAIVGVPVRVELPWDSRTAANVVTLMVVGLAVLGIVSLAPWVAYRVGRYAVTRTASASIQLAASRLIADPRPAGRAAAAVGGIALVAGGAGAMAAAVTQGGYGDSFFTTSLAIVAMALFAALLVVTGTMAVHSVESMLDRKRSIAALVALGATEDDLDRSHRWETGLVALPMAVLGVLLGAAALSGFMVRSVAEAFIIAVTVVGTPGLVWIAIDIGALITRPWARRASAAGNLRVE